MADAQITLVRMYPNYDSLRIKFDSSKSNVPFTGYTRVTSVVRTGAGTTADITRVVVTVSGPGSGDADQAHRHDRRPMSEEHMRTRQGFTLIELLIAMVVFIIILGGALSFLTAQQRMFQRGSDAMGVLQNLSFGSDNLYSQIRTAGGNTPDQQPPVVYAGASTFTFNADYVSNDAADIFAVYIDPDAPASQVEALRTTGPITIPTSSRRSSTRPSTTSPARASTARPRPSRSTSTPTPRPPGRTTSSSCARSTATRPRS